MKKTIILTGASRGIGNKIADQLKKQYNIVSPNRKELNLNDNKSINNFIKKNINLKVDIIINNAGINHPQWIEEITDENIDETFQVNLVAPIKLIRGFVGNMKRNHWGRIINISSAFGIVGRGKQALYASTKHGINGATKALALELAPYNILVNSVCPGFTDTEMTKRNSPEKNAEFVKDIPLGRFAEPAEIGELIQFLISEKNSYITGSCIIIDGGLTCK